MRQNTLFRFLAVAAVLCATFVPSPVQSQSQDSTLWSHVLHLPGDAPNIFQAYVKNGNGGTWTATVNGHTTGNLAYNCTALQLQTALAGLAGIGNGKVAVYGVTGGPWTVIFNPTLTISSTSADSAGLTSNTSASGFTPEAHLDAVAGAHVDHGLFWSQAAGTDLGSAFFWQMWVKCLATAGYIVSPGYGGNHEGLWSANTENRQYFQIWNGTTQVEFTGTYFPVNGEWTYRAVAWDGSKVYMWVNGICEGIFAFAGPRVAVGNTTGGGTLFVGGSTHLCATADIAWLQMWDRTSWNTGGIPNGVINPLRYPRTTDQLMGPCDFAADYTRPTNVIEDLSPTGYQPVDATFPGIKHPGVLTTDLLYSDLTSGSPYTAPSDFFIGMTMGRYKPSWIVDTSCPFGQDISTTPLPVERTWVPLTPPAGVTVYDSFHRRNQTPAFQQHPTLGQVQASSVGVKNWITATPDSFGIIGGQACITREHSTIAWLTGVTTTPNQEVTVERDGPYTSAGPYNGQTGLCARVLSDDDHWEAIVPPFTNIVYVYPVIAGVPDLAGTLVWDPSNDTTFMYLRLTLNGSSIQAHTSVNGSTWVDGPVWTDTREATGTGAGLSSGYWQSTTYGRNSRQRFLMFSVRQL